MLNVLRSVTCQSASACLVTDPQDGSFFTGTSWTPVEQIWPGTGDTGQAAACLPTPFCVSVGGGSAVTTT